MSITQQRALALAYILLEGEFPHLLIAVSDTELPGALQQPDPDVCWHGGFVWAKHLAEKSIERINYSRSLRRPPAVTAAIMNEVMKKPKEQ